LKTEQLTFECQNGFRKGRTCINGIFTLKILIERRREFNLETHMAFLDFEKAFDMVKRSLLFKILQEKNIPNLLLQNIMEIYKNNEIKVKLNSKVTDTKQINRVVKTGMPSVPYAI
jgi:hypothetical protein